jgi:hypothetical protein
LELLVRASDARRERHPLALGEIARQNSKKRASRVLRAGHAEVQRTE